MLEIRLLGEPVVLRDGHASPLPASKKSRALLAYLAVTGRPHLRERLCDLLWEGPDDPRAALRWSLTKLRPVLDPHLVAGRDHVELRGDGASIDIHRLCTAANATTERLIECESLFRGEFAEGLDLPGCFRFQQWCAGERERLRQHHVAILTELSERLAGDQSSLAFARRRVQIDPFNEQAHAALIRLLGAHDLRQEAMQQYEHCRNVFERELGSRPGEIVEEARRGIGRIAAVATHVVAPQPVASAVSFVGRQEELAAIESADGVVLIIGEPGIGKSRLLEEVRRRSPGVTLYGRAFAAEMARPYGVWIDALHDFPTEDDRGRLFAAIVGKLSGADMLAIDDVQWIDEASSTLLHYIARTSALRIVCAARIGEIDDNAHASRVMRELARDHRLTRIDVGPMSKKEISALVPEAVDRDRVAEESGGNPLFALELARANRAGSLTEIIGSRLAQLDSRARDLISWAAAIGRRFDADILGRATEMPSGEMLAALEKLERCAIIRAAEGGCYDFAHDLIRDGAYQSVTGPRRLLVHRHIARALQSVHDPESALAGDIVRHASISGDHAMAVVAAVAAGQRCLRMFAYTEAASVSRLGLQLSESLPEKERAEKQMQLLEVIVVARTPVAERLPFSRQIAELTDAARNLDLAHTASLGAHLLACLHADSDDLGGAAVETIRSAELLRTADPREAAYAMANTARCLIFIERDIPRAQSLLGEVESIVGAVGGEHVEIPLGLGYLHAHRGDDRAVAQLQRALDLAARNQDHWREWCAAARLVTLALETRDFEAARRWCDRLQPVAAQMTGGSEQVRTEMLAAVTQFARGGGEAGVRDRIEELRAVDSKSDLAWALTFLAELEVERGDVVAAAADAREALAAAVAVGRSSEAALARVILAGLAPRGEARRILAPALEAETWVNLSERARRRVLEAASALKLKPKEKRHAQHGGRANV